MHSPELNTPALVQAQALTYGDEIEALYNRRVRRCRILSHPQRIQNKIRFRVEPVHGRHPAVWVNFSELAEIKRFPDRTPAKKTLKELRKDWVLSVLRPGDDIVTPEELAKISQLRSGNGLGPPYPFRSESNKHQALIKNLSETCAALAKQGDLRVRSQSKKMPSGYRLPLPIVPGYPVAINLRTRPRYGWVESVQYVLSLDQERIVVRWLDGGSTIQDEAGLDPVKEPYWRQKIASSVAMRSGLAPGGEPPPVNLPWSLHKRLLRPDPYSKKRKLLLNPEAFLELAKLLEILRPDFRGGMNNRQIQQCLGFLNRYYPDWRRQVEIYLFSEVSGRAQ